MTMTLTIPWVSPMVLLLSHRFFQATRVANLKVDDWGRSLPSRPVVIQTHSSGLGYPKRQIHFVRNLWEVGKMKNLSSFHYQITEWSFETDICINHLKDYKTDKKSTHSSWADSFFGLQSKRKKKQHNSDSSFLPLNDEAGGAVIEVWMTDDVEFCSLLASTLDGLGRPGMAEELVLQKPPPFFAAEFDILSWYSIILWKLSQTCHFYLERQKQVQHSPTVCFNAFFIAPQS